MKAARLAEDTKEDKAGGRAIVSLAACLEADQGVLPDYSMTGTGTNIFSGMDIRRSQASRDSGDDERA
jgi:hypothetical protein